MCNYSKAKIDYMEIVYGGYIKRFTGYNDDRQLYINIYNMIIESLKSLDAEPTTFIRVAIDRHIAENTKYLDEIIEEFEL